MATPIKMPDLGTNTEEIRLVAWLKQEGDSVKRGEPLCEVETDKATDQLESVAEGVLLRHVVQADSEVQSGAIIAYIGQPGESISESQALTPGPSPEMGEGSKATSAATGAAIRVSPIIRKLAEREGVDLVGVVGTGQSSQITREDVLKAKTSPGTAGDPGVPLPKEQLAVARQVARSNREIPTIDMTVTVEMSAVMAARKALLNHSAMCPHPSPLPEGEGTKKVAFDSFFLCAVAQAIKKFPAFAAHGGDDRSYPHESIDICLAVSREAQLYLPVVRGADRLTTAEIDIEVRRLVESTRSGHIRPDELVGGCFTISNLGMYQIDSFQMIIPPDQSGALAIGAIQHRVIAKDGKIALRPVATIVLSIDHRIINGAQAAEFLMYVKDIMETL